MGPFTVGLSMLDNCPLYVVFKAFLLQFPDVFRQLRLFLLFGYLVVNRPGSQHLFGGVKRRVMLVPSLFEVEGLPRTV